MAFRQHAPERCEVQMDWDCLDCGCRVLRGSAASRVGFALFCCWPCGERRRLSEGAA